MEKLIPLAQVEQLIDEMIEEAKREYTREEVAILEVARDRILALPKSDGCDICRQRAEEEKRAVQV